MRKDRLQGLEIFVEVVNVGSFSGAARVLGVSKSHVSKQVSRLEDRLGARLLQRTTRRLTLTDVGRAFHERCAQVLAEIEEAELAVGRLQSAARGLLKISVPMSFGVGFIVPAVAEFMERYPEVDVDVDLSDRKVDIVADGYDLAVRVGVLQDSSLIARKLAPTRRFVCGSPAYFERRGRPVAPHDLAQHPFLLYRYNSPGAGLRFYGDAGDVTVDVTWRLRANNGEALRAAAVRGLGLAVLPDWLIFEEVARGELEIVLERWRAWRGSGVWAVYPHNRHLSPKVRAFVDFLVERFRPEPPWAR